MKNRDEKATDSYTAPGIESVLSAESLSREVHYAGTGTTELPPEPPG